MRISSKIKQGCRTLFTKQLSLVNLAVMSIIKNYLQKSNGNGAKHHIFVSPVKMLKYRLDPFGTTQSIKHTMAPLCSTMPLHVLYGPSSE